jgi:hypothetical protein
MKSRMMKRYFFNTVKTMPSNGGERNPNLKGFARDGNTAVGQDVRYCGLMSTPSREGTLGFLCWKNSASLCG